MSLVAFAIALALATTFFFTYPVTIFTAAAFYVSLRV
jgi:hypothetical protein